MLVRGSLLHAAQDAPLSAAAEEATATAKGGRGVSYSYSSLDTRDDAEDKLRRHAYAPLSANGDGADKEYKEGGPVRLTSRHHVAIPISYFCIGFLGR